MVESSDERAIYLDIQKKLYYIIPEKWDNIYLYASIFESPNKRLTGEMYFYYIPKGIIKKKAINGYEIPNAFNIDDEEYSRLITELYNSIKKLRNIWFKKTHKKWTNLTISIENFKFKVEYDYQNLNDIEFDSYERHLIWRYIYLKLDLNLLSKKDKKIIQRYIDSNIRAKLPKRDIYIEGIYEKPVKNIVDFEKTLSVDEAIAQSETEYIKEKKKHYLFGKRKLINDIIEDEEEIVNNQILNWNKKQNKK